MLFVYASTSTAIDGFITCSFLLSYVGNELLRKNNDLGGGNSKCDGVTAAVMESFGIVMTSPFIKRWSSSL